MTVASSAQHGRVVDTQHGRVDGGHSAQTEMTAWKAHKNVTA